MNRRNTILCATLTAISLSATAQTMKITRAGDTTIVKIEKSPQYLILPVEEEKGEAQVAGGLRAGSGRAHVQARCPGARVERAGT